MTSPTFQKHAEARAQGWFSRRHQNDTAHRQARAKWDGRRAAKMERAHAVSPVGGLPNTKKKAA